MIEALGYAFFQRAILAGVIAGGLCGLLSVYVVARRMAFIGQGIAHAAFGGIALGLFLGIAPTPLAALFGIIMALGVSALSRGDKVSSDTLIGLLMASLMALGVVFLALSSGYTGSVTSYLFGNILAVERTDLIWLSATALAGILYVTIFYKELKFYTFDQRMARIYRIPVAGIRTGFLTIIALAVISSIQVVGIILVTALLVIPGAIAMLLGRRFSELVIISVITGIVSAAGGLALSYALDIPSGATIVLLLAAVFAVVYIVTRAAGEKN